MVCARQSSGLLRSSEAVAAYDNQSPLRELLQMSPLH